MLAEDNAWRAVFSGWFIGDYRLRSAYGPTADKAVLTLLNESHTLVYRIPRIALTRRVNRLPDGDG